MPLAIEDMSEVRREVAIAWLRAADAGSCNGCGARGMVNELRLRNTSLRFCARCAGIIRQHMHYTSPPSTTDKGE